MQTYNLTKEIQQIQNSISIIISCFFIKHNHTLVPKIDPDYINNQLKINSLNYQELSEKISKNTGNFNNLQQSQFSTKHIEFLNKSISQIQLHDLSETTTSKHFDDKKIKEIEKNLSDVWKLIQKQKTQIQELGVLLEKYASYQNNTQQVIKNIMIPDNELSKLNAQIKGLNNQMSVFQNEINQYILNKKELVTKSLKSFSGEYNKLLKMINSVNNSLNKKISSLTTRLNIINKNLTSSITTTNTKIDNVNSELSRSMITTNNKVDSLNTNTNTKIDNVNSALSLSMITTNNKIDSLNTDTNTKIEYVNSALSQSITDTNNKVDSLNTSTNTKIDYVNSALSQSITDTNTKIDSLNTATNTKVDRLNTSTNTKIDYVNSALSQSIITTNTKFDGLNTDTNTKVDSLNTATNMRIDNVNSSLTQTITDTNTKVDNLNTATNMRIDNVNSSLTQTITDTNTKVDSLNTTTNTKFDTNIQDLSDYIDTNFGVLYQDTNQTSGRTVYFDKVKVNEIKFASVSNISDITSLSIALGNLTTNFDSIYQNTNVYSDKTAYFNKVVSQNIECNNFTGVSDKRLKKNIVDLKNVGVDLHKLSPVGFDWKSNNEADIGFIAQDVEKIFPSLVKTNKDGFKSVKYVNFIPILVQGYKEQESEIKKLKKILIIGFAVFFFFFMYKCI